MQCRLNLDSTINNLVSKIDGVKYDIKNKIVRISEKFPKEKAFAYAKKIAHLINTVANNGVKKVGNIAYVYLGTDEKYGVLVNPTEQQLKLINDKSSYNKIYFENKDLYPAAQYDENTGLYVANFDVQETSTLERPSRDKIMSIIEKMGISIENLADYANSTGKSVSSVQGIADLIKGIIAVSENIDDYVLTEEMVHFATAIIKEKNPSLYNEMINKVSRFKIYNKIFSEYKDNPEYQINGKPDVMKIKKEVMDRIIASVILNENKEDLAEEEVSLITKIWRAILDWFKGQYRSTNINIFEQAAETITSENIGTIQDIKQTERSIYYNLSPQQSVDNLYDLIKSYDKRLKLVQEGIDERYYLFDGVRVKQTVTEKVKKSAKKYITREKPENKEFGIQVHDYIANYISKNLIDEDGYKLKQPLNTSIKTSLPKNVTRKLEDYAKELINSYPDGTRFLIETKIVNTSEKGMIASTADFIAIYPTRKSFKVDILDWKLSEFRKTQGKVVPFYLQKSWNMQMDEYVKMMTTTYGAKGENIGRARMIPIVPQYKDIKGTKTLSKISIGNIDPRKESHDYLIPIPSASETTGISQLDRFLESMKFYYNKVFAAFKQGDKEKIKEKLEQISRAMLLLKVKTDFKPMVGMAKDFLYDANELVIKITNLSEEFDNYKIEEFNDILRELIEVRELGVHFSNLDQIFSFVYNRKQISENKELSELESRISNISSSSRRMVNILDSIIHSIVSIIAKKEGVDVIINEGKIAPEKTVEYLSRMFLEGTRLNNSIIKLASSLLLKAENKIAITLNKTMRNLFPAIKALEDKAEREGKQAFFYIGKIKDNRLKLFSKFSEEFVKDVKKAFAEKDIDFIKKHVNMTEFRKVVEEVLKEKIEATKNITFSDDPIFDEHIRQKYIEKIKESYNLDSDTFDAFDNWKIQNAFWKNLKNEELYYSQEYKGMSPEAFKVWNILRELNQKAKNLGYLSKSEDLNFFPMIEATILQKLKQHGSIKEWSSSVMQDMYLVREEEQYKYAKIDPLTGELQRSIPKPFTHTSKNVADLSTDLNKVITLWVHSLINYEVKSEIEHTILALEEVEKTRGSLVTDASGNVVFEGGLPKVSYDNSKNYQLIKEIINDGLYGIKEKLDAMSNTLSSFGVGEQKAISSKKVLSNLTKWIQVLGVGLKWTVSLANHFGAHFQAYINSGKVMTYREFINSYIRLFRKNKALNTNELAFLDFLLPFNENITQEVMRKNAKQLSFGKRLNTWSFVDVMMSTNYYPDRLMQYTVALTILNNHVLVDGKIVNARDYVKSKLLSKKYKLSYEQRRQLEENMENEVQRLIEEKSILKYIKYDAKSGTVDFEGISDEELVKLRTKIIEYSRDVTSQMNQNNRASYSRDLITRGFMLFKNWIPKQISLRTIDIRKNIEKGEWEIGRARVFFGELLPRLGVSIIHRIKDITYGTPEGLKIIQEIYEKKKEDYYRRTGKVLEISEEEFYDLIRTEVKNQLKELKLLLTLIALRLAVLIAAPDDGDDEDELTKNRWKYLLKVIGKVSDEIEFYYNPVSFRSFTRGSILPPSDLLVNVANLFYHTIMEIYGQLADEKTAEEVYPLKYLFKMIPGPSQFMQDVLPMIDPETAKEFGIRVSKESRLMR